MKAANNLCFNFLADANSYKSESNGITVMIWLFGGESSVKVYTKSNETNAVASFAIPTPIDGSNLVIDVSYNENYYWIIEDATMPAYVVKVNEMAVPILATDIMEEGETESIKKAYFSMGSYMDKHDNPNAYTLISINEDVFAAEEEEEPTTPSVPSDSGNTDDGENQDGGKKKGCGSVVAMPVLGMITVLGGVLLLRKKEN